MTWLFTQVWLWSLAAFVLGSLITWLLFVLPMRRRLRALAADYANLVADQRERFDESHTDESHTDESHTDELRIDELASDSALDLLPAESDDREEPALGPWDRGPRPWAPKVSGPDEADTRRLGPVADESPMSESPMSAEGAGNAPEPAGPQSVAPEPDTRSDAAAVGPPPVDETELRMEEQRAETGRWSKSRAEPVASAPTAPPEPGFTPVEPEPARDHAEPESEKQSSWFQAGSTADPAEPFAWAAAFDPPDSDEPEVRPSRGAKLDAEQTGQLRSLFQPRSTPASQSAAADGASVDDQADAAPATGSTDARAGEADAAEEGMLPRRRPGAGPRPGRQNLSRYREAGAAAEAGAGDSDAGDSGAGDAPGGTGANESRPEPQPGSRSTESWSSDESRSSQPTESARQADPPGQEAVGSAPQVSSEGQVVKGHFASRQYHTPDSPQYDRVVAEVWFRSASDAEQAGFEPWYGNQSLN